MHNSKKDPYLSIWDKMRCVKARTKDQDVGWDKSERDEEKDEMKIINGYTHRNDSN